MKQFIIGFEFNFFLSGIPGLKEQADNFLK